MQPVSIFVIDDNPDNFEVVETLLLAKRDDTVSEPPYQLHYASSGSIALQRLAQWQPDLILLDVMMPEMDGIEVCQRIKAMPHLKTVPIIIITALTGKKVLARCLAAGADDFISKPLNQYELAARTQSMLRIRNQQQQLEQFNAQLESLVEERTSELRRLVLQDALTGLPSRTGLLMSLAATLEAGETALALVYLDCDQFKLVNGSLGYEVSNQLLVAIAERLRQYVPAGDLLARIGEDEFCLLHHSVKTVEDVEPLIHKIQRSFDQPFLVNDLEIFASACMGVAFYRQADDHSDGEQAVDQRDADQRAESLLQDADTAMYRAKERGKGNIQFFDCQMHAAIRKRLILENDLQRALERREFVSFYQPIVDLHTQQISGFEALVRWLHPTRGMVSPGEFIPCMEATGLVVPVGLMVLQQACEQLHRWHQQGHSHLTMSVNLSVCQFACPTLVADIDRVLATTGVNPACLKLEITESAIMDNAETAIALVQELRSRQIQISIDDFGTGYSSLGYLHRFPVNTLKIDRSFVSQIQKHGSDYHVVNTIVTLGQQLKLSVVAEGVETQEQLDWLQQIGCEYGQGYLFARPLPAAELSAMLEKQILVPER